MILVDFNQIVIMSASFIIDVDRARSSVLTTVLNLKTRFSGEYGTVVLCCDDDNSEDYWRRGKFVYYKIGRKQDPKHHQIDQIIKQLRDEFDKYLPWRVFRKPRAEADDIIAHLVKSFPEDKHIIVSADKDFIQLHRDGVVQWDPIRKKWLQSDDRLNYLIEHIIRGDPGDGIPNILSISSTFTIKARQKPITEARMLVPKRCVQLGSFVEASDETGIIGDCIEANFNRNSCLIDFRFIPDDLFDKNETVQLIQPKKIDKKKDVLGYLMMTRNKRLADRFMEF